MPKFLPSLIAISKHLLSVSLSLYSGKSNVFRHVWLYGKRSSPCV